MRLSLSLISEYMKLPNTKQYLYEKEKYRYEEPQIWETGKQIESERNILYLCQGMPQKNEYSKMCGFICVCSEEEWKLEGYDGDTLFLMTSCSMEQVLAAVWNVFFTFQQKELALSRCATHKNGLNELCKIFSELTQNAVYIVDNSFKVLAMYGDESMRQMSAVWKALEDVGYVPYSIIKNLIESQELDTMESQNLASLEVSKYFYTPFINYNIRYQQGLQGHFFVIGMQKNISAGDVEIVDSLGNYICETLLHNPEFSPTRGQGYEHFILDVMQGKTTDRKFIEERTSHLGLNMDGDFAVCIVDMLDAHEVNCGYMARELECMMPGKPIIQGNRIYHVINLEKTSVEKVQNLLEKLVEKFRCYIGVSEKFAGFHYMYIYYQQAEMVLKLSSKENPLQFFERQYLPLLAKVLEENATLPMFICKEARQILKHDKEKNSEMADTFLTYLECGRNTVHTAQKMHIHRNTLMYRLDKICELTKLDFDNIEQINRVQISLLLTKYKRNY